MIFRILASTLIWLFVVVPMQIISAPVVAIMLLTSWKGYTTPFGNAKWGKGSRNPAWMRSGYWAAFIWLVWRNPVNNLCSLTLAIPLKEAELHGDPKIGDKIRGGFYYIKMGSAWEYYWIKPYTAFGKRRCIRARIGWKIWGMDTPTCAFVWAINPFKEYLGE